MKFSEMTYTRPDAEALKAALQQLSDELKTAESYAQAKTVFLKIEELASDFSSDATLAQIRHSIDSRDPFYTQENDFWNEIGPELEEYTQKIKQSLLESPFRSEFEKEFGKLLFTNPERGPLRPMQTTIAAWQPGRQRQAGIKKTSLRWTASTTSWCTFATKWARLSATAASHLLAITAWEETAIQKKTWKISAPQ